MLHKQEKDCFERVKKLANDKNDTRLLSFLYKATANSESSLFPDFLFDGGFIEHFQVSAANENKKGSKHNIAVNDFERKSKETFEQEKNKFLQSPPRKNPVIGTYDLKVTKHEMVCPAYNYESFVKSFKRNFEKHINSLQKYTGDKTNGIFLRTCRGKYNGNAKRTVFKILSFGGRSRIAYIYQSIYRAFEVYNFCKRR